MKTKIHLLTFTFIIVISGCSLFGPTITNYDEYAYSQTTSLKVDAMSIMDSAVTDFQSHIKTIITVQTNLQKLCEYVTHKPKNMIAAAQWKILMDSTGHLFGGFIVRWRNEKKLGKAFVDNEKKLVSDAFDTIAELESKKRKQ